MAIEKNHSNQPELLARVAAGDQEAFARLFHQYQSKMFTVSRMYLKTDALAEEALQEIFMKVWVNRTRLADVKDFDAWLFILARNYLIGAIGKWAKNKAAEKSWMSAQQQDEDVDPAGNAHFHSVLLSAIDTLSPQQRTVFRLSKEEQLSLRQIGEQLSLSPLTVKTHLQRAMQQIRRYLSEHPVEVSLFLAGVVLL